MSVERPDRLTIRAALLLGFGLTLGLWLWSGYDLVQQMSQVQRKAAAVSLRYMQAQELLATVRPQVLIVSVNARTALLDPVSGNRESYRVRVRDTLHSVLETLQQYVPVLDSAIERERVERLRVEIDAFGRVVLDVIADDRPVPTAEIRALLARIVPRRELVIGVTDEVQALNRAAFVQEQTTIAEAYSEMQTRVWQRLGLSVLASLCIALLASYYAGRLESRLRRQREKDAQNTRDLQRLSANLVDAQERERRHIARELHDELGQVLEAIKVELTLARNRLQPQGLGHLLDDAQSITQGALGSVRDLSHLLHPAVLDDLGLVAALETQVRAFSSRYAIRGAFVQDGAVGRCDQQTEIAAYRIVQEALSNVVRHAAATCCSVAVRQSDGVLTIAVSDDGCGFSPSDTEIAGAAAGLGLIGIRERVTQLAGTLQVDSAHGQGTTVTVHLPIRPAGADVETPATVPAFAPPLQIETASG